MNGTLSLPDSGRLLIRGVNWLGDAVMTTPALTRLRQAYPRMHLALLTPPKLASLYEQHPALNEIITLEDSSHRTEARLRAGKFDAALIFPNSFRSAWECFGIPRRIGYSGNGRSLLLTHRVRRPASFQPMIKKTPAQIERLIRSKAPPATTTLAAHHLHHYLHLTSALGADPTPCAPHLAVTPKEVAAFQERFGLSPQTPCAGLFAGAEYGPAKRWPLERFAAAAAGISAATDCHWIVFGTDAAASISRLAQESNLRNVHDLTGRTTLRELMAGLKLCRLLLTNDSGPMHVAAALGTPVVVPFGSTDPNLTGPGLPGDSSHRILIHPTPCAPCFLRECPIDHRCMTGISVDAVVSASLSLLRD